MMQNILSKISTPNKSSGNSVWASIPEAISLIENGKMIIVVDDEDRENEGDLIIAAEKVSAEAINFMAREGRGLICVALPEKRIQDLHLPLMTGTHSDAHLSTAFTVSVDAREGITTGISAGDRANTVKVLMDPKTAPRDLMVPGHIFPLQARPGGVLERNGHTEAAVDLTRLAGIPSGGVICEIMSDDGTMSRLPELERFAAKHGLKIISIAELVKYRKQHEHFISQVAKSELPTKHGKFDILVYRDEVDGTECVALVKGDLDREGPTLLRVHSKCITGDIFSSLRCDCGEQLEQAMQKIQKEGRGVIIYLDQEGRGIGLGNKIKAYALQEKGFDTVEANIELGFAEDLRDYNLAAQVIRDLGLKDIQLMTNNPDKVKQLTEFGISIQSRIPVITSACQENHEYLKTKQEKMGHLFDDQNEV